MKSKSKSKSKASKMSPQKMPKARSEDGEKMSRSPKVGNKMMARKASKTGKSGKMKKDCY